MCALFLSCIIIYLMIMIIIDDDDDDADDDKFWCWWRLLIFAALTFGLSDLRIFFRGQVDLIFFGDFFPALSRFHIS